MKALITGHGGFIGKSLSQELALEGWDVDGFDRSHGQFVQHYDSVAKAIYESKPDVVVHLAAEVGKLNCEQRPAAATSVNVLGTLNVAQACAENAVPLVYCSTSEVYGDWGRNVIYEDDEPLAGSLSGMYAITKLAGEHVAQTYAPAGLKIVRPTMPMGTGVPPGPGRRAVDNLIYQALTNQPMIVHEGAARSWCWIDDVARGFRYVIERGEPGIYNVGRDDNEISMADLANKILYMTGSSSEIRIIPPPTLQTPIKRISCAVLSALGWEPQVSLDEGLLQMIDWIRDWTLDQDESAA